MVAIVTGTGLGLERSSAWVLGSRGTLGNASVGRLGSNATVNAANGNLVIQNQDEILIGRGPDSVISRSYNSLGSLNDDNGDNWRASVQRSVVLVSGTINTAGSVVKRTGWDGSDVLFAWDTTRNAYVSKEGAGAYDTITFAAAAGPDIDGHWIWTDGNSRITEKYERWIDTGHIYNGRIINQSDTDGNQISFIWDDGNLIRVQNANGEVTDLTWVGRNLTQLTTRTSGGTILASRTRYAYDSANRLIKVTTDLTPGDNSISDGDSVFTSYTYDGSSTRIASITESGSSNFVSFTYILVGTEYRIDSVTELMFSEYPRTTNFSYDTVNRRTTITDPLGGISSLVYDEAGQLTQIITPAPIAGGSAQITSFAYNANGDVISVTDAGGKTTTYEYGFKGNLYQQRDAAGNVVIRTNGANSQLLTETRYLTPDPDGAGAGLPGQPLTTRYVYDSENHLRFVINAEGEVTEYRYNVAGQLISTLSYPANVYDISGLAYDVSPTEATVVTWVNGITDKSAVQRTDTTYDFRGNVETTTEYSAADAAGNGLLSAPRTIMTYVYDQFGLLLQRQVSGRSGAEVFTYDGLGRMLTATDFAGATTTTGFNNNNRTTTVTFANGLVKTSAFTAQGELWSVTEAAGGVSAQTYNRYDALGRLRMTADATGRKAYFLYDDAGRKVADIAADGALVEYRYDTADRLITTIAYMNRLSSAQLASLVVSGSVDPPAVTVASVRPAPATTDQWEWRVYDQADRLIETIDGIGSVTVYAYDGASQLVKTTAYANTLSAATLTGFKANAPTTLQLPTGAASDRVTRSFYDAAGRVVGQLDGAGYLSQVIYDEAGRKVREIGYLSATTAGLRATGSFAQLLASAGTNELDRPVNYVYDGQGQLRFTLDPANQPTEYIYDTAGHVIRTVLYSGSIAGSTNYSLAYVQAQLVSSGLATNANNRTSRAVYDTAGRLAFSIDAAGGVTAYSYDILGNVIRQVAYAAGYTTTGDPTLAAMQSWATANASASANRISRTRYDAFGRAVYMVDAEGYVTEQQYDAAGRVVKSIRYAGAYTVTDSTTTAQLATAIGSLPADAAVTTYAYNAVGQVNYITDASGVITRQVYNGLGQIIETLLAYGTTDEAITRRTYDAVGQMVSETRGYGQPEASTTSYSYDAFGQVQTRTDGRGSVTSFSYDTVGNLHTTTVPLDDTTSAVTTNSYNAFRQLVKVVDARGNASYNYYGHRGRLILQIDAEGYATETSYSIGSGNAVTVIRRYAVKTTGAAIGIKPTLTTDAKDATTTFERDKLDRVTRVTDGEGFYEQYTLNAFGDRIAVRNKLGGVTNNLFDKRGLLTQETLPVGSTRADGTVQTANIVNKFDYDARGNRITTIEAYGLTEQRTTSYEYDKLDQLTSKTGDTVTVIDPATMATSTSIPVETFTYDLRGNLIKTTDVANAVTFYYYDDLGRRIGEVNAIGTLSRWTYDANGNALTARIYGSAVSSPTTAGGEPPDPVNASNYRETLFTYDRANRLTHSKVANVQVGAWNDSAYVRAAEDVITENVYDAMGNIVQQIDGNGNSAFTYYDKLGRKIAQVDQENYLTSWDLDANGNVLTEMRYAAKVTLAVGITSNPATLRTGTGTTDQRVTRFTYDLNGRRLTETRLGVVASSVSATGALTTTTQNANITYTYNGLGQVATKQESAQEAAGDTTDYSYDLIGRLIRTTGQAFTDYVGASTRNVTDNSYDGLNNLTRMREGGTTASGNDRITTNSYGAGGRLTSSTDAALLLTNYYYDAAGRLAAETYPRVKSDGTTVKESRTYTYDIGGRLIRQRGFAVIGNAWVSQGDTTEFRYNAYGDLTGKGLNGQFQETYDYDAAGRVWRTNAGDGSAKIFVYDANGNQTLTIASSGVTNLAGYSVTSALALIAADGTAAAGAVATITVYDKRGQAVETREPSRERATGTADTARRRREYNAFGEVSAEIDARGNRTDFSYNRMGRLMQKESPWVKATSENGTITDVRPIEKYYYDVSGRMVGSRDANNNLTTRILLGGTGYGDSNPLVLKEFHPDGGVFETRYDVFGDARQLINEIGNMEQRSYDKMGRLTTLIRPTRTNGTTTTADDVTLTEYYAYDGLGQRIQHWNSQFGSSVKELTDYDGQGRVTRMVDYGGSTTTYSYSWNGALATAGMGTFGAWTKTTVNTAGKTATEVTDYFGRTIDKVDFGGHNYDYTYNKAGWLTQRTNGAGETINYGYYNSGRLKSTVTVNAITNANSTINAAYTYDVEGNRTNESYATTVNYSLYGTPFAYTTTHQNAAVTWDAMNRMISYDDTAVAGKPVSIDWEYDANSNIRRMQSSFYALNEQGDPVATPTAQDYWYKYDSMNRFVTTQGVLSGGTIIRGGTGTDITYNAAGQRTVVLFTRLAYVNFDWGGQFPYDADNREEYAYTADGFLSLVKMAQGDESTLDYATGRAPAPAVAKQRAVYVRDAIGRITNYTDYAYDGTTVMYSRAATYDNRSLVLSDTTQQRIPFTSNYQNVTTTYYYNMESSPGVYNGAFQGGVVVSSRVIGTGPSSYTQTTANSYAWWDGAVQSSINISSIYTSGGSNSNYTTTYNYDGSGHIATARIQDGRPRTVSYVTDSYGQVLVRDENDALSSGDPRQLYFYFNGTRVADVGNNGTVNVDFAAAQSARTATGSSPFYGGYSQAYADFDQSYNSINPTSESATAERYTVRDGDTLQTIASAVWGDSSLWYMLADANGLNGTENLQAGITLSIPNKVANAHNNSSTFRPYDPNKAIGDTSPTAVKPPKKPGCGVFGTILLVAIAVAVAYFAGPVAVKAFGTVAGGAITGAAASVISQGVGIATGAQDKFSFKQVGLAALAGGIGGAMGPSGNMGKIAGSKFLGNVVQGTISSALTQGLAVATGLQNKFDWAGVAAAGIGGGVGGTIGGNKLGDRIGRSMADSIASTAARSLLTGTNFGDNLIATLPSIIGNTIGNLAADGIARAGGSGARGGSTAAGSSESGADEIRVNRSALERAADAAFIDVGVNGDGSISMVQPVSSKEFARAASQAAFNRGLSGDQLMSIYGGGYDVGYTVSGGNQAGTNLSVQRTAPDVRVYQFDGNGDIGYYRDLGDKKATFMALREATALADANVSDVLRPISGPIDTALSFRSIVQGEGTWGDYGAVTLSALPVIGKGVSILRAAGAAERAFLSVDDFAKLPRTGTIDAKLIRFSQDSAAANFKPPFGSVDDFASGLANKSIDPATIKPIRIVDKDGMIFTLDNRRLYAFQKAGVEVPYQRLDAIPKRELFKFTTQNDGASILIRQGK